MLEIFWGRRKNLERNLQEFQVNQRKIRKKIKKNIIFLKKKMKVWIRKLKNYSKKNLRTLLKKFHIVLVWRNGYKLLLKF